MKYIKFIFFFVPLLLAIVACNQEDDICTEGGSPKMKVKFKKEGNLPEWIVLQSEFYGEQIP